MSLCAGCVIKEVTLILDHTYRLDGYEDRSIEGPQLFVKIDGVK